MQLKEILMFEGLARVTSKFAKDYFGQLAGRVGFGHERIIITKNGRDHLAVVSLKDLELLLATEAATSQEPTKADIQNARKRTIPIEEVYRDYVVENKK
jgi:hypothetical protein